MSLKKDKIKNTNCVCVWQSFWPIVYVLTTLFPEDTPVRTKAERTAYTRQCYICYCMYWSRRLHCILSGPGRLQSYFTQHTARLVYYNICMALLQHCFLRSPICFDFYPDLNRMPHLAPGPCWHRHSYRRTSRRCLYNLPHRAFLPRIRRYLLPKYQNHFWNTDK